jgi:hypothetical protein
MNDSGEEREGAAQAAAMAFRAKIANPKQIDGSKFDGTLRGVRIVEV